MSTKTILVIGDRHTRPRFVLRRLAKRGAQSIFASSREDASQMLRFHPVDLVLTKLRLPDGDAFELIPLVEGKSIGMFCYLPAKGTFWWLPLVKSGQKCWGEHAVQTRGFLRLAEELFAGEAPTASDYATAGS